MRIIEYFAVRIALAAVFAVGMTVIAGMLAWHYWQHGAMPET